MLSLSFKVFEKDFGLLGSEPIFCSLLSTDFLKLKIAAAETGLSSIF